MDDTLLYSSITCACGLLSSSKKNRIRYDNSKTARRQKLAKGKALLTELYERRRAGRGGRDRGGVRDGEGREGGERERQ